MSRSIPERVYILKPLGLATTAVFKMNAVWSDVKEMEPRHTRLKSLFLPLPLTCLAFASLLTVILTIK